MNRKFSEAVGNQIVNLKTTKIKLLIKKRYEQPLKTALKNAATEN